MVLSLRLHRPGRRPRPVDQHRNGRRHGRAYRHSPEEIRRAFGRLLIHHEPISPVFRGAIGDEGYVFRAADLAELEAALQYTLAQSS
ncbi:MAG: hypothetical protein N2439_06160 [Anaerolineae bacterium]|nr:hypothetical protein [Anaerolineae bacterium]